VVHDDAEQDYAEFQATDHKLAMEFHTIAVLHIKEKMLQ
jgi:hypothetical protein